MTETIPKIIHYVWFGKNPKPPLVRACLASWKRVLPEYEIREWNEDNIDISENLYAREALAARQWAFVSDYVRLKVLHEHGGIYLDVDVEVFRRLDRFLGHGAFTGFERYLGYLAPVTTAVMGARPGHPWIAELLSEYQAIAFEPGVTNTSRISRNLLERHAIESNNQHQVFGDDVHIYPAEVFCVKTDGSYTCHHFSGSWLSPGQQLRKRVKKVLSVFTVRAR